MKVSLLSLFVVAVLPEHACAQQPGYLRQTAVGTAARAQFVQNTEPAHTTRIEAEYRFPLTLSMTATGYHNGQKRESNVEVFYINPARGWVATPSTSESKGAGKATAQAGLRVYDLTSYTMLVLNIREKRGMAVHLAALAAQQAEERRTRKLPPAGDIGCHCEPTGKKKTIEGFHAVEYSCKNAGRATRYDMWVTRELKTDLAPPGSHSQLNGFLHSAGRLGGVPLEGYYYEHGDLKSSLLLTDVNRAAQFFVNTEEYKLNLR